MTEPFIGQIDFFAFDFYPQNYLPCTGGIYQLREYQALFSLLGNRYGGDAINTFGVPDLRGRVAVGLGQAPAAGSSILWSLNTTGGSEKIPLSLAQYPHHTHDLQLVAGAPNSAEAAGVFGPFKPALYGAAPTSDADIANTVMVGSYAGGSQAHDNMQPYLPLTAAICWYGIYPDLS